ncbi:SDR family NAD(P)-dependent oxidoreductase [Temperatibacter marinus]|uniref:SDR family NAD(P)-dependent oxidoreductase n=1 Tax=Temperatibacter marinus TaxID=1456591 RepID=A0AA52EDY1_9PROT|nr:SDR family NAD(P)-dependent oxidoreductase [Temperatibacter marinus]WND03016.1 SDR family NAD(P)-dependent oxidoreductase [Temperatibacter marinus]
MSDIRFDNQVAIITGAGQGLGRTHALGLASRGAKVIVNDMNADNAQAVSKEIEDAGGLAIANSANVAEIDQVQAMVQSAMDAWGRVDILVNNAGILRDKSFAKMDMADFELVVKVHLLGSALCAKAVWDIMRDQGYGRIVMTTSSSGMYGNFGQANYGAAKCGVTGLMNTLCLEGERSGIKVNTLSPTAFTQMTDGLLPQEMLDLMTPESVTAGLLTLCDKDAPNRTILCAGAGAYARTVIHETDGVYLKPEDQTPEAIRAQMDSISDLNGMEMLTNGWGQTGKFVKKAADNLGIDLPKG